MSEVKDALDLLNWVIKIGGVVVGGLCGAIWILWTQLQKKDGDLEKARTEHRTDVERLRVEHNQEVREMNRELLEMGQSTAGALEIIASQGGPAA